jgi:hypothetical protein
VHFRTSFQQIRPVIPDRQTSMAHSLEQRSWSRFISQAHCERERLQSLDLQSGIEAGNCQVEMHFIDAC